MKTIGYDLLYDVGMYILIILLGIVMVIEIRKGKR